jgi:putative transposase
LIYAKRNRTSTKDIGYGLYLYFLGLSYRNTTKALSKRFIKRSHVSIWKWVQNYKPERISFKRKKISEFIIDETQIKVGQDYFWVWVVIDSTNKTVLGIHISSLERNMLIAEEFLHSSMINKYGKHPVSTDGGTRYPQACRFLKIKHHLHSSYQKSIIERTIQSIKDRTEILMTTFHVLKLNANCNILEIGLTYLLAVIIEAI